QLVAADFTQEVGHDGRGAREAERPAGREAADDADLGAVTGPRGGHEAHLGGLSVDLLGRRLRRGRRGDEDQLTADLPAGECGGVSSFPTSVATNVSFAACDAAGRRVVTTKPKVTKASLSVCMRVSDGGWHSES